MKDTVHGNCELSSKRPTEVWKVIVFSTPACRRGQREQDSEIPITIQQVSNLETKCLRSDCSSLTNPRPVSCTSLIRDHTRLFSEVLENGTRISSIPKADNSRENSNFRPISILLLMSEVYQKLVLRQMATYLSNNAILESNISAYRTGHSTTTAMFAASQL